MLPGRAAAPAREDADGDTQAEPAAARSAAAASNPPAGAGATAASAKADPGAEESRADAKATDPPEDDRVPSDTETPLRVEIAKIQIEQGRATLEDRTVRPFFHRELEAIHGTAKGVRWPKLRVEDFDVSVAGLGEKPVVVTGHIDGKEAVIEAEATRIRLTPLNPYLESRSDYAVQRGSLTLDAELDLDEAGGYEADLDLRLHDLRLHTKPGEFKHDFGVSLELGMALLRDLRGDIVLSVPIAGDAKGTRVGVFSVVRRALHRAILNAMTTPLKILGAVVRRGGEVARFEPAPIPFETGTLEPTAAGTDRLRDLADVLASKPQLVAVLRPVRVEIRRRGRDAGRWRPRRRSRRGRRVPRRRPSIRRRRRIFPDALVRRRQRRRRGQRSQSRTRRRRGGSGPKPAAGDAAAAPDSIARQRMRIVAKQLEEDFGVPSERVRTQPDPVVAGTGPPRVDVELAPRD